MTLAAKKAPLVTVTVIDEPLPSASDYSEDASGNASNPAGSTGRHRRFQEQYRQLSELHLRSKQLHLASRRLREMVVEEAANVRLGISPGQADADSTFALGVLSHSRRQVDV